METIFYKRILTDYNFNKNINFINKKDFKKAIEKYKNDGSIYCFEIYDENENEIFYFNRDCQN